jgi:hypothetical protein
MFIILRPIRKIISGIMAINPDISAKIVNIGAIKIGAVTQNHPSFLVILLTIIRVRHFTRQD